jgi:DNA-binding MarR family transcriptional regulator
MFHESYNIWMPLDVVEVRNRSKQIFGNRYMLEVCAALSGVTERTNLAGLVGDTGLSPSLYVGPLHRLEQVGLLVREARPEDDRRERWYRPVSTGLWRAARELADR